MVWSRGRWGSTRMPPRIFLGICRILATRGIYGYNSVLKRIYAYLLGSRRGAEFSGKLTLKR